MANMIRSLVFIFVFLSFGDLDDAAARGANNTEQAHAIMQAFFDASGSPGLSVSVGLGGDLIWSEGFGYADLEQMVPVDPANTRFRIGSTIKPMTAFAAAQLVEAGKLDLDAPVQTYVPDFPEKRGVITTRQLLAHLSGIRHYGGNEFFSIEQYDTVLAGLVIFKDDPLKHMPGESYSYSSYGYNLVSAVIESASGKDFLLYMTENVFKPLGMDHTSPDFLKQIIPGRGRYYYRDNGTVANAPEVNNSYKWASGGFVGTSDDLVRFGMAQFRSERIRPATRDEFWTVQTTLSGEATEFGLGWRNATDRNGVLWIGHGGGSVGGTTTFWIRPDNGLVIALISNMSSFDFEEVMISLAEIWGPE